MVSNQSGRAKQFAPFAALTGYYDIINDVEKVYDRRRELSEEQLEELSRKVTALKKGDMARLTVYNEGCYEKISGIVTNSDFFNRTITIVKRKILLDDVYDVEIVD